MFLEINIPNIEFGSKAHNFCIQEGECETCGSKGIVLDADTSGQEYKTAQICEGCLTKYFRQAAEKIVVA